MAMMQLYFQRRCMLTLPPYRRSKTRIDRAVVCLALLAQDTNVENGVAARAGLSALKQCGGITVVHDPSDAAIPEMPTTTLTRLEPDHVVGLAGTPRVETLTEIHRQPCSITRPLGRALMARCPLFPRQRAFLEGPRTSALCHFRTHAPQAFASASHR